MATLRLVRAAERRGAAVRVRLGDGGQPAVADPLLPGQGAGARRPLRVALDTTVFSPSIVYSPGDPWLTLLERLACCPRCRSRARAGPLFQPIWAEDVADCVVAALRAAAAERRAEFDWPGPSRSPTTTSCGSRCAPRAAADAGARAVAGRAWLAARAGAARRPGGFATWEEAELMEEPMTTSRGTADAEALGVNPLRMSAVLGAA